MASGASSRTTDNGSGEPPSATPPPWRVEGAPPADDDPAKPPPKPPNPMRRPRWWLVLLAAFALNWLLASLFVPGNDLATIDYTRFRAEVDAGNVATISAKGDTIQGELTNPIDVNGTQVKDFTTERPSFADDNLYQALTDKGTEVSAKPIVSDQPWWLILLANFGPTLLLVGLLVFATRALRGGMGGGIGGLGRSKAVRVDETEGAKRTTFDDVAGIDEVEEQVVEIVDFLRHPDKYRAVGAQLPRGVLLSGLPGTGKTLLARALAGEAGVPFFSASASEFIEMIVGVGASRVRDLFEQAKKVAPAIIFIDELDAIGRARGGGASLGGVDEREQTLNQILTEMDGFTGAEGVIVVAATNRPDVLDPALLRPGRFDRRIVVNPPDITGREAILKVHTRGVPLAPDVSLATLAAATPGMVGADLKNLINEGALLAASKGETAITYADLTNALEKIVLGAERHITLSEDERRRTAFHESGHALLGMLIAGADPVRKVSIIPRGQALGVTFQAPSADRYGYDEAYLRGRITGALGGRAAEDVVYGNVTTGAESDLEQVTAIARQMVGRWGMSEAVGPITVLPGGQGESWYPGDPRQPSESTRELVDAETRRMVDECYDDARRLLREHRPQLDALAAALLERETLDELDAYAAAGVDHPAVEPLP
ncbi:MAG: ATP-dependent zinc metalloprotease FtsH [Acidimicrobiales bacterium]